MWTVDNSSLVLESSVVPQFSHTVRSQKHTVRLQHQTDGECRWQPGSGSRFVTCGAQHVYFWQASPTVRPEAPWDAATTRGALPTAQQSASLTCAEFGVLDEAESIPTWLYLGAENGTVACWDAVQMTALRCFVAADEVRFDSPPAPV